MSLDGLHAMGWPCSAQSRTSRFLINAGKVSKMSHNENESKFYSGRDKERGQDRGNPLKEVKIHNQVDMGQLMWSVSS